MISTQYILYDLKQWSQTGGDVLAASRYSFSNKTTFETVSGQFAQLPTVYVHIIIV